MGPPTTRSHSEGTYIRTASGFTHHPPRLELEGFGGRGNRGNRSYAFSSSDQKNYRNAILSLLASKPPSTSSKNLAVLQTTSNSHHYHHPSNYDNDIKQKVRTPSSPSHLVEENDTLRPPQNRLGESSAHSLQQDNNIISKHPPSYELNARETMLKYGKKLSYEDVLLKYSGTNKLTRSSTVVGYSEERIKDIVRKYSVTATNSTTATTGGSNEKKSEGKSTIDKPARVASVKTMGGKGMKLENDTKEDKSKRGDKAKKFGITPSRPDNHESIEKFRSRTNTTSTTHSTSQKANYRKSMKHIRTQNDYAYYDRSYGRVSATSRDVFKIRRHRSYDITSSRGERNNNKKVHIDKSSAAGGTAGRQNYRVGSSGGVNKRASTTTKAKREKLLEASSCFTTRKETERMGVGAAGHFGGASLNKASNANSGKVRRGSSKPPPPQTSLLQQPDHCRCSMNIITSSTCPPPEWFSCKGSSFVGRDSRFDSLNMAGFDKALRRPSNCSAKPAQPFPSSAPRKPDTRINHSSCGSLYPVFSSPSVTKLDVLASKKEGSSSLEYSTSHHHQTSKRYNAGIVAGIGSEGKNKLQQHVTLGDDNDADNHSDDIDGDDGKKKAHDSSTPGSAAAPKNKRKPRVSNTTKSKSCDVTVRGHHGGGKNAAAAASAAAANSYRISSRREERMRKTESLMTCIADGMARIERMMRPQRSESRANASIFAHKRFRYTAVDVSRSYA